MGEIFSGDKQINSAGNNVFNCFGVVYGLFAKREKMREKKGEKNLSRLYDFLRLIFPYDFPFIKFYGVRELFVIGFLQIISMVS